MDTIYMTYKEAEKFGFELKKSLPDGTWIVYSGTTDRKKSRKRWKDKKGFYDIKYRGRVILIANYNNSMRNGKWIEFQSGQYQVKETHYKNGVKHGKETLWYNDTLKGYERYNADGKRNGSEIYWDYRGNKTQEALYRNDSLIKWTSWHSNGQKASEGFGDYCYREEKLMNWYENGQIKKELNYKNGALQKWERWYENGNKMSEGFGGVIDDDVRKWYSWGECPNSEHRSPKQGIWSYWNEDGKLIKEEEYKYGLLIKDLPDWVSDNPKAPTVTTEPATEATQTTAKIIGTFKANGAITSTWFEVTNKDAVVCYTLHINNTGEASCTLTGLKPNTTYNYRIVGVNNKGVTMGVLRTFTSKSVN